MRKALEKDAHHRHPRQRVTVIRVFMGRHSRDSASGQRPGHARNRPLRPTRTGIRAIRPNHRKRAAAPRSHGRGAYPDSAETRPCRPEAGCGGAGQLLVWRQLADSTVAGATAKARRQPAAPGITEAPGGTGIASGAPRRIPPGSNEDSNMSLDAFRAPPLSSDSHHPGPTHGEQKQEHGA